MTKDIERAAFEATQNTKVLFESIEYIESTDAYMPKNGFGHSLVVSSLAERLNFGWSMWKAATKRAEEKLKGCVVVPVQCPDPDFADSLFDELSKKAIGEFGDDLLIHFSDIDEEKIWALMVEAAKAQAVPEGFVLVNKKDLVKVLNCVTDDWLVDTDSFEEFKKIESLVQDEVNAMIEAQEQKG